MFIFINLVLQSDKQDVPIRPIGDSLSLFVKRHTQHSYSIRVSVGIDAVVVAIACSMGKCSLCNDGGVPTSISSGFCWLINFFCDCAISASNFC